MELLATVALLLSCGWTAYLLAARWLPEAPTSVRWCAAAIIGYWSLVATFLALASVSMFRAEIGIPMWVAAAVALHAGGFGGPGIATLGRDWRRVVLGWSAWRRMRYGVVLVAVCGTILGLRFVRSMLAPPLTWDALTYHLLKAGRWVQAGGFVAERAPDAWGYYEYFQPFGDYLWAWAMLPVHGDLLIGPAGVLVWATCLLGTYTLARTLGAAGVASVAAALFVTFNPTVVNYLTTAHVENVLLAAFVLGAVFLARSFVQRDWVNPVLAAAALGVLAGVKFNGAPVAALGALAIVVAVVRRHPGPVGRGTRPTYVLAGCVLALALGAHPYLRAWYDTGSPFYPFHVAIGAATLSAGNPELAWVMARADKLPHGPLFQALFVPKEFDLIVGREQFLNPGPPVLLIGLTGLIAAIGAFGRIGSGSRPRLVHFVEAPYDRRPIVIYLLIASAITIAGVATSDVAALRTVWANVLGRFLLIPLAAAAIFTALLPPRVSVPLLLGGTALGVPLTIPLGWGPSDRAAFADPRMIAVLATVILVAYVVWLTREKRLTLAGRLVPATAPVMIGAVACILSWGVVREIRDTHRHAYFRDAADERAYDPHWLGYQETAAFPLWRQFDRVAGASIAVSAGWHEYGHNWFRYPLLGSRLQNRVVYVPITSDGTVVDYRDDAALRARSDYRAWLRRLVEQQIDYLVLLHPEPPEAAWVRAHPDIFTPAGDGRKQMARAYRLNHAVAAAAVTTQVASR